ncbi:MAG: polynucleotide adenylyltransferase PcnB [Xanthomonadales bacterium]|nr:polynucleotide adenylyltransferase PcnB [Xanthomonadales bacterium]
MTPADHGIDARQLCPNATEVVERLQDAGFEAYIVGGSVRDLLLGKIPKDFDIATDATPEEVKKVFPRCRLIGRRFRLAHVRMRRDLLEVATFRGQGDVTQDEEGRILRDNVWGTVAEDAVRRDFTINALFMDPVSGDIRDYVNGYPDLRERRLKLIGDPATRYREDPVRILRAARFIAKLGVEPDASTVEPMAEVVPQLEQIPPARLFEEVCKMFLTGHGQRTMETLQRFGLTRYLFPVLEGGADGKANLHPIVMRALKSTDDRIAQEQSVTPAFLIAALLWGPVEARYQAHLEAGASPFQAMERAGDEVLQEQVRRTAVPRRFSTVTRQIWLNQVRLTRTRGKRALSILRQPRFRAAYDFLVLRSLDDPELTDLAEFWTEAQKDMPEVVAKPQPGKRRRRRRRGGGSRKNSAGAGGGGS